MAKEPAVRDPLAAQGREPMQRVRVGVTGLAAIVLIVALATAIASGVQRSANASDSATVVTGSVMPNAAEKSEPLEQLGVTPPTDKDAPVTTGGKP